MKKATEIVHRIDDLRCVVIPKEIRRTMCIREGDPLEISLTLFNKFCRTIHSVVERVTTECPYNAAATCFDDGLIL